MFFNTFYKNQKILEIKQIGKTITKKQNNANFLSIVNNLALDKEVCIEIDYKYDSIYNSESFGKRCFKRKENTERFKFDFISSNKKTTLFQIKNKEIDLNIIIYAIKLDDDKYAYINTNIIPVKSFVTVIIKQLFVLSFIIITLSFILAYYISNKLANPIKWLDKKAKKLATGDYNVDFTYDSNILEINNLSDTLNYTKNELSKTDEFRRDIMANISHDLKTPLTMIKAYAEMSSDLHINDKNKQIDDMNVIITEADRLALLVNDILELSKAQTNIDSLKIEKFDIVLLTLNIINNYEKLLKNDNYNFIFSTNSEEILIKADKKKIEQVIYNLISNAINYTGKNNKVYINIIFDNNEVKIEITDTGKGIKKEDLPYIWDKYYKNKKKHKRNLIGTGLGLAIVKNILVSHNFEYGVNSSSKGSTFYFIIKN